MNFDDLPDDEPTGSTPQTNQQPGAATAQLRFDDLPEDQPQGGIPSFDKMPDHRYSTTTALATGAAKGAAPVTAGIGTGLAVGAATSPFITPVGGVLAGVVAGAGGGFLVNKAQDWILDKLGLSQTISDIQQSHPTAFQIGEAAPAALSLRPSGSLAQRAIGGLIGGGATGVEQAMEGEFDPTSLAIATLTGAALPNPNKLGQKFIQAGERAGASVGSRINTRATNGSGVEPSQAPETPGRPDLKATDEGGSSPGAEESDIEVANDLTTTSRGVAAENPPAPQVAGAGNPEGAPMLAREASRPTEPGRDYRKSKPVVDKTGIETQDSTVIAQVDPSKPMGDDVAAALKPAETPVQAPAARPDVRPPQAAAQEPQPPVETGLASYGQEKPVTAAVTKPEPLTPNEIRTLAEVRKELARLGHDQVIAKLDELPPKEQAQRASQLRAALASETGEAVGRTTGQVRKETPRPKISIGVQARSKGDAAKKQATLDAVMGTHKEFGPEGDKGKVIDPTKMDKKDLITWAKSVMTEATKRNGGRDPLVRSKDNYVPVNKGEHTPAYQWLRAVKSLAAGKELKNFQSLHVPEGEKIEVAPKVEPSAETAPAKEAPAEAKPSISELDRETQNIEADIQKRPSLPEAATEAQLAKTAPSTVGREEFEPLPPMKNSKGEIGKDQTYVEQQNELRSWLNNLSDADYARVQAANEERLQSLVSESNDPKDLHSQLMQDLAATTGKRPGIAKPAAEDVPGRGGNLDIPTIQTGKFEPTEAGAAATKGKSLKETNPELFKKLAAQYGSSETTKPRMSTAERLAAETTAADNPENLPPEAIKGGWDDFGKKVGEFMGDTSGAMRIPSWLLPTKNSPASPSVSPEIKEYTESLGNLFNRYVNRVKGGLQDSYAAISLAPTLTPKRWETISKAYQNRDLASLSADDRAAFDKHVKPLIDKYNRLYDDMDELNDKHNFGLDMPDRAIQGASKEFQPRQQKGKQMYDKTQEDAFDPLSGRNLSAWAPTLEQREWFGLQDTKGNRMTVNVDTDKDGNPVMQIWRNGKAQTLKNLPSGFEGKVGDAITLKVKGVTDQWSIDHATNDEIKTATKGKVEFHENPVMAWSQAIDGLHKALSDAQLIVDVKNDPRWEKNTTTNKSEAKDRGYDLNPANLEALGRENGKPIYMPRNLRWALEDFFREGVGGTALDPFRNAAQTLLKSFFALSPLIHPLNELNLFAVSRGSAWLKPSGYKSLYDNSIRAFKSVNEQDYHQRAISQAGGNPMLGQVIIRDMYPKAAKRFGMDIANNPSKWDPIARLWDTSTPELAKAVYNTSSDITWRLSDYLLTIRYFEGIDKGLSQQAAAREAHEWISDYRTPPTMVGSGEKGRALASVMKEPAFTAFGRYKYGIFKSYANATKALVNGTPDQRKKAIAQLMTLAVITYGLYPLADKAVQAITGNEEASVGRRGASTIPSAVTDYLGGGGQFPVKQLWSPSIPLSTAWDAMNNQDWTGKPIIPQGAGLGESGARVAEWGLRQAVPPYASLSRTVDRPDQSVGGVLGDLAAEQVGVKVPSESAQKFKAKAEKRQNTEYKARLKGHPGIIPELYYGATGQ